MSIYIGKLLTLRIHTYIILISVNPHLYNRTRAYEAIRCMSYLVQFCTCVFSVLLALRLPRLGKRELILVLFVRLIDLCLFGFVGFLFLLVSGKGCGLWLWHSLDFFSYLFFIYCVDLSLYVSHLFFWCIGKAVLCDCSISWYLHLNIY